MNKGVTLILALAIAVAGFFTGRWSVQERPRTTADLPKYVAHKRYEVVAEPPVYTSEEASDLRATHYEDLSDIESVLDLPTDFAQTEALYAVAGRADQSGIERLIGQAAEIANRFDRVAALSILFGRYSEIDPDAAVDYLVGMKLDVDEQMFGSIFDAWAKTDLNAAVAKANQLSNSRQRKRAASAILTATSRFNEALLEQVASDLRGSHSLTGFRSEAVGVRATLNPQVALQEALAMNDISGRWSAISRVAQVWARNDPAQALDAVELIADQQIRSQYVTYVLQRWVADDPDQAMQYLSSYPDGIMREKLMHEGLTQLANERPEEAMMLAMELSSQHQEMALTRIAMTWANNDPDAAMVGLMALENTSQRDRVMASIGQNLAMRSPDKAFRWLEQMSAEPNSEQVVSVLMIVAQSDPRRALEHVMNTTTGEVRSSTLIKVLERASSSNPSLVMDYVNQLPDNAQANQLYQNIAGSLVQQDTNSAIQWIGGLTGNAKFNAIQGALSHVSTANSTLASRLIAQLPPERTEQMISSFGTRLVYQDPDAAISWLAQYRGQQGYSRALTQVVHGLSRTNPQHALRLTSSLEGTNRSEVTEAALSRWARNDPVGAARWAMQSESTVREAAVSGVVQTWGRSDPVRATDWALSLPSGDDRDRALVLLSHHGATTLNRAVDIVSSIASETEFSVAVRAAYHRLLSEQGSSAADALLEEVDVSDEVRASLRNTTWQ